MRRHIALLIMGVAIMAGSIAVATAQTFAVTSENALVLLHPSGEWETSLEIADSYIKPDGTMVILLGDGRWISVSKEAVAIFKPAIDSIQKIASSTIKIATQSPLSGGMSAVGVDIRNGALLAVEQKGGMLAKFGMKLALVPFDDQGNPDSGVANAKRIVRDPSILAVIGHYNSGIQIPSSEEYHAAGLANISPANTNPKVTERGYIEVSRVVGRDDFQGDAAALFAKDCKVASVSIVHDYTAYGQGIAERFRSQGNKSGIRVLDFFGTETREGFDEEARRILNANPDAVFFGGMFDQSAVLLKTLREQGFLGYFISDDGFDASDSSQIAGAAILEGQGAYFVTVAGNASVYPNSKQFVSDFIARFGYEPQPFAAQAYDSAAIAISSIVAVINQNGGKKPSRSAVSQAIRSTKAYQGITGKISFNTKGDLVNAPYFIVKVTSSNPMEWAQNEIVKTVYITP